MAYIGNDPSTIRQGRRAVYEFTATNGQTDFLGTDDNGLSLDLLQAVETDVYLNGSRLVFTDDYTISGDTLTLTSGAALNDIIVIVTQGEVQNAASYTKAEADARYINYDGDIVNGNIQVVGDISLGDNNKINLGADSDLQIFHDGTHSFVVDNGTGGLQLRGSTFVALQGTNGENGVLVTENGSAQLRFNNSPKLETTGTGIDVTGTVTADKLSIGTNNAPTDSDISLSGNAVIGGQNSLNITTGSNGFVVRTGASDASAGYSDGITAFRVQDGGDVSFFDTSANAKLFWDASAERLGIGTTSPEEQLHVTANIQAGSQSGLYTTLSSNALTFHRANSTSYIDNPETGGKIAIRTGPSYDTVLTTTEDQNVKVNNYLEIGKGVRAFPSAQHLFVQRRAEGIVRFDIDSDYASSGYFYPNNYVSTDTHPYVGSSDSAICFNPGGTRVWFGQFGVFYQYELSTPYDISTRGGSPSATFTLTSYAGPSSPYGLGMTWWGNGNYVWFGYGEYCNQIFSNSDTFTLYSAASPYDVTSLTKIKDTTVGVVTSGQGTSVVEFNPTGTKAYVGCRGGTDAAVIYEWRLNKPFDLATRHAIASYTSSYVDNISLRIDRNGEYMYTGNHSPDVIVQYKMSTPWDVTSITEVQTLETNLPSNPQGAFNGLFLADPGYY